MSVGPGKSRVCGSDSPILKKIVPAKIGSSTILQPKKTEKPSINRPLKKSEIGQKLTTIKALYPSRRSKKSPAGRFEKSDFSIDIANGPLQNPIKPLVKHAPSMEKQPQCIETIRVKHKLVLGDKQRTRLEGLFMAPKALATLLRTYPQKLVTPADASVFLLRNRKELDGYINPDARERSVDLLTELLLQWSGNPPDSIGIDFDEVSLAADQKVYLPLDGLRSIEVADPMELLRQRKDRRFKEPFTLFEEDKQFFVTLTLEPRVPARPAVQITPQWRRDDKPREIKSRKIKIPEIQLKPGQPLPYISGMRSQPKEPKQRVLFSKYSGVFSGGIKTMNWGGLSGWGVNGGLPSLGKRSR